MVFRKKRSSLRRAEDPETIRPLVPQDTQRDGRDSGESAEDPETIRPVVPQNTQSDGRDSLESEEEIEAVQSPVVVAQDVQTDGSHPSDPPILPQVPDEYHLNLLANTAVNLDPDDDDNSEGLLCMIRVCSRNAKKGLTLCTRHLDTALRKMLRKSSHQNEQAKEKKGKDPEDKDDAAPPPFPPSDLPGESSNR